MAPNPTRSLGKLQTDAGVYCMRLPDDDKHAQKLSRAVSERIASDFFASNGPWNEFPNDASRRFDIPRYVVEITWRGTGRAY